MIGVELCGRHLCSKVWNLVFLSLPVAFFRRDCISHMMLPNPKPLVNGVKQTRVKFDLPRDSSRL